MNSQITNVMVERTEFVVLYADSGEYAGNISDGSDCTFETIEEARAYMARRAEELADR